MKYNFDQAVDRRGTGSLKWDSADRIYGGENLLPMWIADMDFAAAPPILEGMRRRLELPVFGYDSLTPAYYQAVIDWMDRRHGYHVEKDWICYTPGVICALGLAVQATTEPGDEVLVNTPVYGAFFSAVTSNGRILVKSPLNNQDGYYTFDFEDMEGRVTDKTKALMLCSPHNPVGRVWDKSELERLAAFCQKHNLFVIADEIHQDLVYGKEHTVFAKLSPWAAEHSIICTAPSKTFNVAGIHASNSIIQNEEVRARFQKQSQINHTSSAHSFVECVVTSAYNQCGEWLDELRAYLEGNVTYFCRFINEQVPGMKVWQPEGTYLVWVDCSGLGLDAGALKELLVKKCGLALNEGKSFGDEGLLCVRVNLACPRSTVERACQAIKSACQTLE